MIKTYEFWLFEREEEGRLYMTGKSKTRPAVRLTMVSGRALACTLRITRTKM